MSSSNLSEEIAIAAARFIVEDGMEYGPAKRRAAKVLGRGAREAELPSNETIEDEVRTYLALFCADTQPAELAALRELAIRWMEHLPEFRPHLTGAVWRGTATRLSDIRIELFCDDSKAAELALLDRKVDYDVSTTSGPRGKPIDVLSMASSHPALDAPVTIHLLVLDYDDLRGALRHDARGGPERGDLDAVRTLVGKP